MTRRRLSLAAALFLLVSAAAAEPSAGAYLQSVANLIAAQQDYPRASQRQGEEGEVRLRLTLDRQGRLLDLAVAKSSGFPALDGAALEMARKAFPVPPPPAGLGGDPLVFDAPVYFRLDQK